jgi:hypothetical protein
MNWNFSSEILVRSFGSNLSWIGIIFLRKILVLSILWRFFFVLNSPLHFVEESRSASWIVLELLFQVPLGFFANMLHYEL